MSDNQAETALAGVVVTGEAKEALELDDQPEVALNDEPMCDHICLLREGHVEEGRPHFYGYRLGPGSPSWLVAEVERLRAQRDEALAFAIAGNDPGLTLQQIVRVLSRTEDGGGAFWRDKVTGEPCPRRGKELCTITDKEHRHVASHMWRTEDGTND